MCLAICWNLSPANYLALHCNIKIRSRKKYGRCSKLTIKTPEQRRWGRCGIFIVIFEHILHLFLVLLWLTLNIFFVSSISHILHLWYEFTSKYDFYNPREQCQLKIIIICYFTGWAKNLTLAFKTTYSRLFSFLIFYKTPLCH